MILSTVAKLMEGSELRTNLHLAETADAKATSHAEDGWRARAVASLGLSRPEPSPMGPVRPVQPLESVSGVTTGVSVAKIFVSCPRQN